MLSGAGAERRATRGDAHPSFLEVRSNQRSCGVLHTPIPKNQVQESRMAVQLLATASEIVWQPTRLGLG